jgi:hypothetical protein
MLNLEENLTLNNDYIFQQDFYIKGFCYAGSTVIVIDFFRGQVSEINLLQLIPGVYLFLLLIFFVLLVGISDFFLRIPIILETKKASGGKTSARFNFSISLKFSLLLYFFLIFLSLNTIIPISFDSFNISGEKALESLWSFNDVISLEMTLLFYLVLFSQIPIIILFFLSTEKSAKMLPKIWRPLTLFIITLSGFLTPTIDGYTQLSFSATAFSVYILVINFLQKRVNIKFNGGSIFG